MLDYLPAVLVTATFVGVLLIETMDMRREARRLAVRTKEAEDFLASRAGAPPPTTTPVWREAPSDVVFEALAELNVQAGMNRGSPASPLLPTTLASLQALGEWAHTEIYHAEHCSVCQAQPAVHISRFRMLAQAVVDLASTSASEATNSSVAPAPAPATSGSSVLTDANFIPDAPSAPADYNRIKAYPSRTVTASDIDSVTNRMTH